MQETLTAGVMKWYTFTRLFGHHTSPSPPTQRAALELIFKIIIKKPIKDCMRLCVDMFCSGAQLLIIKRTIRECKMFTASVLLWCAVVVKKKLIKNCKRLWLQTCCSGAHLIWKKGWVQAKCCCANKITWVNGGGKLFVLSLLLLLFLTCSTASESVIYCVDRWSDGDKTKPFHFLYNVTPKSVLRSEQLP